MKLWERFLKIIYKIAAKPFLNKYKTKSLESILGKSLNLLDGSILAEIRNRVLIFFSDDGGFADRGGKSDLYYSLFGCFVAEALSINEVKPHLKEFTKNKVKDPSLSGINLYCGAILYSKLIGNDEHAERLKDKVRVDFQNNSSGKSDYSIFLSTLALFYLQDYQFLRKLLSQNSKFEFKGETPSTLVGAEAVLHKISLKSTKGFEDKLMTYYRGKGGFVALKKSPIEDLLSTSVALYALHFIEADIKQMKPDCLSFIDGLYLNGGFRATEMDFDIDIEYTFYGLLALGALAE
ncbi:MAG: hypothetical protein EHM93_18240 [Bacteroidales bacterium]|nr:MAG: hypothetical protein EHM93_18240 [Bacteroidales bacterium]